MRFATIGLVLWLLGAFLPADADTWEARVTDIVQRGAEVDVSFSVFRDEKWLYPAVVTLPTIQVDAATIQTILADHLAQSSFDLTEREAFPRIDAEAIRSLAISVDSTQLSTTDIPSERTRLAFEAIPKPEPEPKPVDIPVSEFGAGIAGALTALGIRTITGRKKKEG